MSESTETLDVKIRRRLGEVLLICGLFILLIIVPLIVLVGGLHWLKFKSWPDWSANAFGFYWQETSWQGVNDIMWRVYHLHILWLSMLVAIVGLGIGIQLAKAKSR